MSSFHIMTIFGNHLGIYAFALFLAYYASLYSKRKRYPLPPSPPGALPVVGHVFEVSKDLWIPFTEWKHKYGDILYLNMIGQPVIVLNSLKVAVDLLDRRSAIYSDRPRDIIGGEMLSGNHLMVLSPYNERWRRIRRAAHDVLSNSVLARYQSIQCTEAATLILEVLKKPDSWKEHIDRMTNSCMLSIIYGNPLMRSHDEPAVKAMMEYVRDMTEATAPGKHLTQLIPALEYLPLWMAPWKKAALEGHDRYTTLFTSLLNEGKNRPTPHGTPTLASSLGEKVAKESITEKEASWIGAALITAGTEAVLTALGWIMQTLIVYPMIQTAGQEEVDRVVGRDRLPNLDDLPELHYVRAIVQEVMRLYPATPFAIPHSMKEHDWYEGYFLPKGSTVIANVWAINRDPETYGPDAETFNPNRFLNSKNQLKSGNENHCTYGFGRRKCVGSTFANNTLVITTAYVLWALKVGAPKDAEGREVKPDINAFVNVGMIRHAAPFKISVEPRSEDVERVLTLAKEFHGGQE